MAYHAQGVEEATQVTKPVKQAIGLPVDNELVCADADLKAGEFVARVGVFFGRVNIP